MNLKFEAPTFLQFAIIMSCVKLLLLNSYKSTDFEVHRNWLAITYTLPVSEWYFEETSEWTLDYPPFFAWFEYALSQVAVYFDDQMLDLDNLGYNSVQTVLFQRLSVIVMDLVLLYSLHKFYDQLFQGKDDDNTKMFLLVSIFANSGLLLVDHIHFQYNGFLFSFLLLSITDMLQDKFLPSAFWFTVLLNFKHIFLYIAPCYFVYLLRNYCFRRPIQKSWFTIFGVDILQLSIFNVLKLAFVVIGVFMISFGPFIYLEQIPQVVSRLFPVKRGLCHAYWAANFWAVYATTDKVLTIAGPKLGLPISKQSDVASMTGGLVAQQNFSVLPNIPAIVTGIVTILFMLPALLRVWYRPYSVKTFLPCLTLCAYASFLFGYHVHEKAILLVVIPLTLLALLSSKYARVYIVLSITGHYALFPLLYQPAETPLKILILLLPTLITLALLKKIHKVENGFFGLPFVTWYESLYLYGLAPLYLYTEFGHQILGFQEILPFVPLMMTSFYCSIGVIWSWLLLYSDFLLEVEKEEPKKKQDASSNTKRKTKKKIQ